MDLSASNEFQVLLSTSALAEFCSATTRLAILVTSAGRAVPTFAAAAVNVASKAVLELRSTAIPAANLLAKT